MNTETITVKNLWHNPQSAYSRKEYKFTGRPVFEHRGVLVYHIPAGSYLHVLAGVAIMERAGVDKTGKVIDELLSGESSCCDAVAAHLVAHGFSPMSYSEYWKLWNQGLVA